MNLSLLIENAMYGLSQLFMLPVLLLVTLLFFYSFHALGRSDAARTARADELQGASRSGTRVDVHVSRQLAPGVDLRLAGENLLGARDRSTRLAVAAGDSWMLAGRDGGDRTWLLTVEGKW